MNEIHYPIFLECCEFTTDTFWEQIFQDLAYGNCPRGTYVHNDHLFCSYKGKGFSYKIERKDPKILYTDIYNLLKTKLGILSNKEKAQKRLDFHQVEKDIKKSRKVWSNIRKKNVKDLLIERYAIKMRKQHSLTITQTKYLLSLISIALIFKVITPEHIVYEDGEIKEIQGLIISKNKIDLECNIYEQCPIDVENQDCVKTNKKKLSDGWEKFYNKIYV